MVEHRAGFLDWIGVPKAPRIREFPPELMRPSRVFLIMGYMRWYMTHYQSLRDAQEELKRRRKPKGNFGILVNEDLHALCYQRLEFAIRRVEMSLHWWNPTCQKCSVVDNPPGVDGLTWEWNSLQEQRDEMRKPVDEFRERAVRARAWLARLKPEDHPLYDPPEEPGYY